MPSTTHKAARALTAVISAGAAVLYGVILSDRDEDSISSENWAWNCLPLIGLCASVLWNFLSLMTLCTGNYFFFPRRFHLAVDVITAILALVLGFMAFAYNVVSARKDGMEVQQLAMQYAGAVLLSFSCIAHAIFFCCARTRKSTQLDDETETTEEKTTRPPSIWAKENPFDDAASTRSTPLYDICPFEQVPEGAGFEEEAEGEKKEPKVSVTELRGDDSIV